MKMKMFLLALPCSALLILGPSSLIAFADELPCLACAERSRGQIIFIGGIDFIAPSGERVNTQFTLYNPNEHAEILITEIRVIDTNGDSLPLADPLPVNVPESLPGWNTAAFGYDQLLRDPFPVPPFAPRSQVLFTWESASNEEVFPLKITGLEFRLRRQRGLPSTQIGRNTTHPHLILEIEDGDDDDDKDRDDDDDDDDD